MKRFVLFLTLMLFASFTYPLSMDAHCGCGNHHPKPPKSKKTTLKKKNGRVEGSGELKNFYMKLADNLDVLLSVYFFLYRT